MTSQINPATIDGNYPVAGVPNNTQGMRDNFTATKTNFQYAETEINELQSKGVFKAALAGTTLDNNLANNLIYNAKIQGFSGTLVQIANTSGSITVDCSAGHFQTINMGGNISITFTTATWPPAGSVGILRLQVTVDQAGRTMTLPAQVSVGTTGIQGYSANVITFAAAGVYEFGFLTYDQGISITLFDYNRPLSYYTNAVTIAANTVSTNPGTGALIVSGGVGIGGNLYVNGDIYGNVSVTDVRAATVTAIGNVTANYFIGNGSQLTDVVAGNVGTLASASVTGNVRTGNLNSLGVVSSTGNVIGGNITTAGQVSATANITGGNLITAGAFSAASVSASGNVTGGNVITSGLITATGAITTAGNITSLGNIAGTYYIGDGSQLTGVVAASVGTLAGLSVTGNTVSGNFRTAGQVSASGNISGSYFSGVGLSLSGNVVGGINSTSNVTTTANISGGNLLTAGVVSATANVTGGNFLTAGAVSATGNVTGGNLNAAGLSLSSNVISAINSTSAITTNANVSAGNILTSGVISAVGNITANGVSNISGGNIIGTLVGNVTGATTISASANVIGGNILTAGVVSATANVTGGNILTAGVVSATANVTGGNIRTVGQVSATANVTGGNVLSLGIISATGNITGNVYFGNASQLTIDGTNFVGYKNIPQNSQSADYTLVLADAGKHIFHPELDAARTFTIPANSSVPFPIGTAITFINLSANAVSITSTDGLSLSPTGTSGTRTLAQFGSATCIKYASTQWLISGSGLT